MVYFQITELRQANAELKQQMEEQKKAAARSSAANVSITSDEAEEANLVETPSKAMQQQQFMGMMQRKTINYMYN